MKDTSMTSTYCQKRMFPHPRVLKSLKVFLLLAILFIAASCKTCKCPAYSFHQDIGQQPEPTPLFGTTPNNLVTVDSEKS